MGVSVWIRVLIAAAGGFLPVGAALAAPAPDCLDSAAPLRCEAYRQGALSCLDLSGGQRRACVEEFTPTLSCRGRPERCRALPAAQKQCDTLQGAGRRQCVLASLPAAACKTHANPVQCQRRDEAERACIAESGSANRLCVAGKLR
ncbi:hypothetical protein [Crenobacter cavernae]|uniref:Uncharacterized protein n=1 Tax=Crenobacter cavernae TaxID=2290923 RepID=A0A345Y4M5_9NEIS|nr:hypothetical protein [Crenobacter cavernae]AXK38877.1 hypothetical protein DWG20_05205 [Crenobacter cavernae]